MNSNKHYDGIFIGYTCELTEDKRIRLNLILKEIKLNTQQTKNEYKCIHK